MKTHYADLIKKICEYRKQSNTMDKRKSLVAILDMLSFEEQNNINNEAEKIIPKRNP